MDLKFESIPEASARGDHTTRTCDATAAKRAINRGDYNIACGQDRQIDFLDPLVRIYP